MAKKKRKTKHNTNITAAPKIDNTFTKSTITITKTLGLCPVCDASSINIDRYITGDILLYSQETAHAYDVVRVEEIASPRKYYKNGVEYSGHRIIVTCVCSKCNSTWSEDYDTAIPTDVYDIVNNENVRPSDVFLIDKLSGYGDDMRDDTDNDDDVSDIIYGDLSKKHRTELPPYIADPTPLFFETSITKATTSKGDKK